MARIRNLTLTYVGVALSFFAVSGNASAQDAGRVTIGIGSITSTLRGSNPEAFLSMLETQLIKTNKFSIIERSRLQEILKEKGLGAAGVIDGASPKISGVSGVDYLVYGSVTKLGESGQGFAMGGINIANSKVEMAVDLRVVDAHNGQILYADTVQETAAGRDRSSVAGVQVGNSASDPLGDVQRLTAKSITARIVTSIYPIKVVAVQGDGTVVVNYGDSVLTNGDRLTIFEKGESFKDPDTGEVLGAEEKQVAVLQVTDVTDKFSKTHVVTGNAAVGNIARKMSASEIQKANANGKPAGKRLPR